MSKTVVTAIIILVIVVLLKAVLSERDKGSCIFTCSTFFDFKAGDRWERFCRAIDSIREKHSAETLSKIDKWVVINEWSANPKGDWSAKMRERYPDIIFIQKGQTQKGQAHTLNMCLRKARGYKLWIHWEEAWEVRKEFLDDAFKAMGDSKDITQLQFTYNNGTVNWLDVESSRIDCEGRICRIAAARDTEEYVGQSPYSPREGTLERWPLYSLLPSINRVSDYEALGEFNEDPGLWPVKFEWDFARRWWRAGCKKAVMKDGPVWRPGKHMSTYA